MAMRCQNYYFPPNGIIVFCHFNRYLNFSKNRYFFLLLLETQPSVNFSEWKWDGEEILLRYPSQNDDHEMDHKLNSLLQLNSFERFLTVLTIELFQTFEYSWNNFNRLLSLTVFYNWQSFTVDSPLQLTILYSWQSFTVFTVSTIWRILNWPDQSILF
jgi:hypothetical protein